MLVEIGQAMAARHQVEILGALARCHARHVEACAETAPFPRQYHCANAFHAGKLFACGDDPLKHLRIKRVHLVRTRQADIGNMIVDINGYAVVHASLLFSANSTSGN